MFDNTLPENKLILIKQTETQCGFKENMKQNKASFDQPQFVVHV